MEYMQTMWITSVKIKKDVQKHKLFLKGQVKIFLPFKAAFKAGI